MAKKIETMADAAVFRPLASNLTDTTSCQFQDGPNARLEDATIDLARAGEIIE